MLLFYTLGVLTMFHAAMRISLAAFVIGASYLAIQSVLVDEEELEEELEEGLALEMDGHETV